MGGYGTFFVSPGFDPFGSGASTPPDAMLIGNAAFAFADADNASEALRIHRELVVTSVTTGTVRIEVDENEDGKLDRWEYHDEDQNLRRIGSSRANNGVEDAWLYPGQPEQNWADRIEDLSTYLRFTYLLSSSGSALP